MTQGCNLSSFCLVDTLQNTQVIGNIITNKKYLVDVTGVHTIILPPNAYREYIESNSGIPRKNTSLGHFSTSRCKSVLGGINRPKPVQTMSRNLSSSNSLTQLKNSSGGIMARLNLEDQFFLDYPAVLEQMPGTSRDAVIGNAVRFFRFAQEQHKNGKCISEEDFKRHGFFEDLIPIFAERTEHGIRAIGAEKHFNWLLDKSEAGRIGGQVSAQRPRNERGQLMPKQPSTAKQNPKQDQAHQPSPSSSLSYSSYNSNSSLNTITAVVEKSTPTALAKTFNAVSLGEVLSQIPSDNRTRWLQLYDNDTEFIQRELTKAVGYYFDNPKKKPKTLRGWLTALSSWLERGWTYRAKGLRGEKSENAQQDDILKIIRGGSDVAN